MFVTTPTRLLYGGNYTIRGSRCCSFNLPLPVPRPRIMCCPCTCCQTAVETQIDWFTALVRHITNLANLPNPVRALDQCHDAGWVIYFCCSLIYIFCLLPWKLAWLIQPSPPVLPSYVKSLPSSVKPSLPLIFTFSLSWFWSWLC